MTDSLQALGSHDLHDTRTQIDGFAQVSEALLAILNRLLRPFPQALRFRIRGEQHLLDRFRHDSFLHASDCDERSIC